MSLAEAVLGFRCRARDSQPCPPRRAPCRRNSAIWSAGLRRTRGFENATGAAPAAVSRQGLLTLDLSSNRLGDAGAGELARALSGDSWLVGVNLSLTGLTDAAARALTACLVHNKVGVYRGLDLGFQALTV